MEHLRCGLHLPRVLEGDDAGERNEMAEGNDLQRLLERPAEAMEDPAHASGEFAQDRERVVPRIALMDDRIEAQLGSQIELLAEKIGLTRLFGSISAGFSGR